jgi:hypothetical protein
MCFFYIGALLGRRKFDFSFVDSFGKSILLAYPPVSIIDVLTRNEIYNNQIHKIGILFGIAAVFYFTKHIRNDDRLHDLFKKLSPASFFVFATHEPLLTVVKKLAFRFLSPTTEFYITVLYFTIPFTVITVCVVAYRILIKVLPGPTRIVTGGR